MPRLPFYDEFTVTNLRYIMMNDDLKAYEVLMRRLLRGAAHQWPYAVASFFVCALGGVGLFLLIQAFHVVNRKEVVGVAEKDGLNGDEVSLFHRLHHVHMLS